MVTSVQARSLPCKASATSALESSILQQIFVVKIHAALYVLIDIPHLMLG